MQEFVISCYNRTVVPDLADKNANRVNIGSWRDDNAKINGNLIWSIGGKDSFDRNFIVMKDNRFSELDELLDKYSERIDCPEEEKPLIEKKLYSMILLLMKEGRVPKSFQIQPFRDSQIESLTSKIDRIAKLIDNLERRVKGLENLVPKIPK